MTSNVNTKSNGQSNKATQPVAAPGSAAQGASVPISLYREVASDLQSTRTTLQSVKTQNQELTQKNQQLRLEIERVVQSALHLRQLADSPWGNSSAEGAQAGTAAMVVPAELSAGRDRPAADLIVPASPEALFTEQPASPTKTTKSETPSEISTWWLILIICTIVITAFGTGFLIVRPLLPSR